MNESAASNFINSLVRNLQVLCHSNVEFRNDIEVVGHLYLKVDKTKKFNYIVDEKVCKNDASSTMFVSNSYHSVNLNPKKKDGQPDPTSKLNSGLRDVTSGSDHMRPNEKRESRISVSPMSSGVPDVYKTPIKRGLRSPEAPLRKVPRMLGDSSGGTTHQAFSFSLQRDRESPNTIDRTVSQDSSSSQSFKDSAINEPVEIDLTSIKEEVMDDKSAIQASCFFNQEQQHQMLGHSSISSFSNPSKESNSDEALGLYPVSLHPNENPNLDSLAHLSSSLASSSSPGGSYGQLTQSPQQMPQFLSDNLPWQYMCENSRNRRPRKELNLEDKINLINDFENSDKKTTDKVKMLMKQYEVSERTVYLIVKNKPKLIRLFDERQFETDNPSEWVYVKKK